MFDYRSSIMKIKSWQEFSNFKQFIRKNFIDPICDFLVLDNISGTTKWKLPHSPYFKAYTWPKTTGHIVQGGNYLKGWQTPFCKCPIFMEVQFFYKALDSLKTININIILQNKAIVSLSYSDINLSMIIQLWEVIFCH